MSSTEEGGGAVGAVSTDQAIIDNNNNPLENFTRSNSELRNLRSLDVAFDGDELDLHAKPLIQRVPSSLGRHEDFRKYFKPKVISIGPLHHNDSTLHKSKKLKLKLAALFVKKIGVDKETLYNNMKTEIDGLKKCYDPKGLKKCSNDNVKLAWILYALRPRLLSYVERIFIKNELLTFVYSVLFLLENQLPFRVLELLTRSNDGTKFMEAIIRFIDGTVKEPQSHQQDSEWWPQQGEGIHLLHLLRVFISFTNRSGHTRTKRHHSHPFGNVKELKSAGIWLEASETSCLTDISFKRRYFFVRKLRLPPITVDDSTMNLIAYEMCPDFHNNFAVTSYMGFLDSLIDEAEDVKELRDAGILYNRFGSDKEVPSPMIYRHVKLQIHDHHNNMWIRYPAQVYRTFFRTRWTLFAFVGAIAACRLIRPYINQSFALDFYYSIHNIELVNL
ncbi:hypothetical protein V6Z11_D11G372600 [Gossypium hirsutum]